VGRRRRLETLTLEQALEAAKACESLTLGEQNLAI
jgi:hypothetical protein